MSSKNFLENTEKSVQVFRFVSKNSDSSYIVCQTKQFWINKGKKVAEHLPRTQNTCSSKLLLVQ